ncbi:MAG: hypothetical protein TEF_04970 [Rhizobiales bacterium NRL2]|jgi:hypothetical protein|nr:MAG: hypothetical protein TEF_04970 [Rhizobiales bacterium NRL2]
MIGRLLLLLGLVAAPALAAGADEPTLGLPLRCELNRTCFIQQFMDIDPGPGASDYACGPLTYDDHSGTDFRLPDRQAMRDGVEVIAALGGVVRGTRDGMADVDIATIGGREAVKGRECGNGVVIDHTGGWQTQYCHMRQGSLRVRTGQRVEKGQTLGLVGMSGAAQFPHIHLAVRKDGADVDPFRGIEPEIQCGGDYNGLWDRELTAQLDYRPGGILNAGLYGNAPQYIDVKEGRATVARIEPGSPALVVWFHVFGIREGDVMRLQIESPDGGVFHDDTRPAHPKNQAQYFAFSGRRAPDGGLKPGVYSGRVQMLRDGRVYDARRVSVEVR